MPSERSHPAVSPRPGSAGQPIRERTYDEKQVSAILHRAARLDHDRASTSGALTLREIEAIARDAGIDPSVVRQAARDLEEAPGGGIGAVLAGAPVRRTIERVVDGEIGAEDHERLAQEIREVLSSSGGGARWIVPGHFSSIGRTLSVSGFAGVCTAEVTVGPRDGQTVIRIGTDRSNLAGGLFGGIVGGVGGGVGANVGWMIPFFLHLPAAFGLAGAGLVVLGAYGLARSIFARNARALDRTVNDLANRLEAIVRDTTAGRSTPPG